MTASTSTTMDLRGYAAVLARRCGEGVQCGRTRRRVEAGEHSHQDVGPHEEVAARPVVHGAGAAVDGEAIAQAGHGRSLGYFSRPGSQVAVAGSMNTRARTAKLKQR